MDSNLKVGSNNAGLFVGNIEILGGRTVDVASNCISFLYGYNNWDIYPHTDIIYDYRLGDGDNVDANEDVQGKANEVLFDLINQGSYLVLRIKS
jgi:hypothetical protein